MNAPTDHEADEGHDGREAPVGHEAGGAHGAAASHAAEHDFTGPLSPGVARLLRGLFVVCGVLVALDFAIDRTTHAPGESLPGFYAAYGFVGCVLLVLVAKQMRKVVGKRPDHYEPAARVVAAHDRRDGEDHGC